MKCAILAAVAALFVGSALPAVSFAQDKIPVTSADELPRHSYPIDTSASGLLADPAKFSALMNAVVADTKADLSKYDIQDRATLEGFYVFLQAAANLRGDDAEMLSYIPKLKALETNEDKKLTTGLTLEAHVVAKKAAAGDRNKYETVFKQELEAKLKRLPLDRIRQDLMTRKQQFAMISRELIDSSVKTQVDPIVAQMNGSIPGGVASQLVMMKLATDFAVPNAPLIVEVYDRILTGTESRKRVDVWTPRLVTLDGKSGTPVIIGIWDTGIDVTLFPKQLWTNPSESANGKDDDNNGFIDDLHGVAFDMEHRKTSGPLISIEPIKSPLPSLLGFLKGGMDMQAGIESDDSKKLTAHIRSLAGESLTQFQEELSLIGNYTHGTHVAGIAAAGNPLARLMHVRETFDYKLIPQQTPSVESAQRWADSSVAAIDYMKKAGVRVVNMSWRYGRGSVEAMLAAKGIGKTSEERAELSRKIFAIHRDALQKAIAGAPEILFVAGAGNENNDLDFSEYIPAGLSAPNLVTVGAVDEEGKPAVFTSSGKSCKFYANGWMIDSVVPGGTTLQLSGTSMAAPQMANLAAKLIALKPSLTTAQVIELIRAGADPMENDPERLFINPAKSIELLKQSK